MRIMISDLKKWTWKIAKLPIKFVCIDNISPFPSKGGYNQINFQ